MGDEGNTWVTPQQLAISIAKVNSDYKVLMIAIPYLKAHLQDLSFLHLPCVNMILFCYSVLVSGVGHCYCEGHKSCRESNKGKIH